MLVPIIVGQVTAQANRIQQRLASVKYTVAVMSGKGGVGKECSYCESRNRTHAKR